jgi:hypothetical protein
LALLLVIVIGTGLLVVFNACVGKSMLDGLTFSPGGVFTPLPDNATVCAFPPPLSKIVSVADRDPVVVGVNLTGILAIPPPADTVIGVTAVVEKSPGLFPVKVSEVICTDVPPVFVTVTDEGELATPVV